MGDFVGDLWMKIDHSVWNNIFHYQAGGD